MPDFIVLMLHLCKLLLPAAAELFDPPTNTMYALALLLAPHTITCEIFSKEPVITIPVHNKF